VRESQPGLIGDFGTLHTHGIIAHGIHANTTWHTSKFLEKFIAGANWTGSHLIAGANCAGDKSD
jgi:hypothetical protein